MLLHPFSVMVLLCAGVLIVGTTIRGFAVNLDVTASVPAVIPSSPATITNPTAEQHVSGADVSVGGTCPPQTYVELYRNALFAGVAQCASGAFHIQATLLAGANELRAQVYNVTDQAGPAGTPLTVYYDATSIKQPLPPADAPTTMWVSAIEAGNLRDGAIPVSSSSPTVSGWAPPWSRLTVTFHSDPQTCVTQADGLGWWSCTLDRTLPPGIHHVDVVAVTSEGKALTFPTFSIRVNAAAQPLTLPAPANPLLVRADYRYQVYLGHQAVNLNVGVTGGASPYRITGDWGDGTTTQLSREDDSPFTLSHTYPVPTGSNKEYLVLVHAADATGHTALLQLSVLVKGNGIVLIASNTRPGAFLDDLHHWLWLIWPAYMVVALMTVGYYLGEREEYQHLMAKRRSHAGKAR